MAQEFKERTITINLSKAAHKPATKRAISAKNMLIAGIFKETRLKESSVSNQVNELIWGRGKYNAPRKMTVKVINEKGRAIILLPSEKYEAKQDKADKKSASTAKPGALQEKKAEKKDGKKEEEKKDEKAAEKKVDAKKAESKPAETKKETKPQEHNKSAKPKETAGKAEEKK